MSGLPPGSTETRASGGDDCPDIDVLEAIVRDEAPSDMSRSALDAIHAHVNACPSCRRQLDEMRRENAFIARLVEDRSARDAESSKDAPSTPPPVMSASDEFPGYVMHEVLAIGGQGIVYRAKQIATGRIVAIKVPVGDLARRPSKNYRFRREVELTARLDHPSIVDVMGVCESLDGRIGCVMEFVDGTRFDQWAAAQREDGRQGVRRIVAAVRDVAAAIAHAHQNAVLHRDIKPGNVIMTAAGTPRVLDFGIAKALDDRSSSFATVTGAFVGTLIYSAPEQVANSRDGTDVRTDVHGLGLLLYTALAGGPPWDVEAPTDEILRCICDSPPPRPTQNLPAPDAELDAIVLKAMAKEKSRRYQSAAEFADDLERWLDGAPVRARFDSRWYVVRKTLWRQRRLVAVAGALALVLGLAAWLAIDAQSVRHREAIERDRADAEELRTRALAELMRSVIPPNNFRGEDEFAIRFMAGLRKIGSRLESGVYASEPAYETALQTTLGTMIVGSSIGSLAEVYARSALVSRQGRLGTDHAEVATGLHDLAVILLQRMRYAEALQHSTRAIELRRRHSGERHRLTAASLELRARVRLRLNDGTGAVSDADAARRALALDAGDPGLRTAILRTAAEAHDAIGAREEAWSSALEALREAAAHLMDDDPLLHQSLVTLGNLAGDRDGALPPVARALGVDAWPDLAEALLRLGEGLAERLAPSEEPRSKLLERVLAIRRELLGPEHLVVGFGLLSLAEQFGRESQLVRAVESFEASIPIIQRAFGDTHPAVANVHSRFAGLLSNVGRSADAADHERVVVEIHEAQPPMTRDELAIAVAYGYLLRYEFLAGRYEAALRTGREAMVRAEGAMGNSSHVYGLVTCSTACALSALGLHDEAEALVERGWRVVTEAPATSPDQRHLCEAIYGLVISRAGREEEGRTHLIRVLETGEGFTHPTMLDHCVMELIEGRRRRDGEAAAAAAAAWYEGLRGTRPWLTPVSTIQTDRANPMAPVLERDDAGAVTERPMDRRTNDPAAPP